MKDKCRKFTGMMNDECTAGVNYMSMRVLPPEGGMARWPCHHNNLDGMCPSFVAYTDEEIQTRVDGHNKVMQSLDDLSTRESDICFHCGKQVMSMQQVGPCVYAQPCNCRLWQGRIPKAWETPNNSELGNVNCAACGHSFTVPSPDEQGAILCPECGRIT